MPDVTFRKIDGGQPLSRRHNVRRIYSPLRSVILCSPLRSGNGKSAGYILSRAFCCHTFFNYLVPRRLFHTELYGVFAPQCKTLPALSRSNTERRLAYNDTRKHIPPYFPQRFGQVSDTDFNRLILRKPDSATGENLFQYGRRKNIQV